MNIMSIFNLQGLVYLTATAWPQKQLNSFLRNIKKVLMSSFGLQDLVDFYLNTVTLRNGAVNILKILAEDSLRH